ncbi:KilA-N domain-containing protein [Thiovulum sp. ES]|nr:KilA-N domain-containing protein [Thiovulum sp. ES]
MNTDQKMTIQIGKNHTVKIGHLSQMGSLTDIFNIGNGYRELEGKKPKTIEQFLSLPDTWEFITEAEIRKNPNRHSDDLKIPTKDNGKKVLYGQAIKKFSVIKSQKGGKPENRGYWANLHILLKGAIYLSAKLEYEVIDVFINQKILFWRDVGGDNFKEFNKIVDTLPDRKEKNNTGIYVSMSKRIRQKLSILSTKGYNEKEHDSLVQENRAEWLKTLGFAINVGWIKSFDELKNTFDKLELIEK